MVFGVRADGAEITEWKEAEKKQQHLQDYKIFATNKKFGDTDRAGALSRMTELMKYKPELTEKFGKYFYTICKSGRPVQPRESVVIYDLFSRAAEQKIEITDGYIKALAKALSVVNKPEIDGTNKFENDLNMDLMINQAKAAHDADFLAEHEDLRGISRGDKETLQFFYAQVEKGMPKKYKVPFYNDGHYEVDPEFLF
jgi:hypothetical protein